MTAGTVRGGRRFLSAGRLAFSADKGYNGSKYILRR